MRSLAYHVGTAIGRRHRVVVGELSTGSSIVLDPRDPAHREILFFGATDEGTTRLFKRFAKPGWTVLDVGANAGYFSLLAHDLGGAGARVHAFEPNPRLRAMFESSVERAGASAAITVVGAAVGGDNGTATLHVSPRAEEAAFATARADLAWSDEWEEVTVEMVRLDRYCSEHGLEPDLVKLDVEGFEPEAIRGMDALLSSGKPSYVITEVVRSPGRPDPEEIARQLGEYGYTRLQEADTDLNACFVAPGVA
jgi:FkbM family methyltransferase